jgi:hypothetical protein
MADRVLLRSGDLRQCLGSAEGHEDRVVAEAAGSAGLPDDHAIDGPLDGALSAVGQGDRRGAAEGTAATAFGHVAQLTQDELKVRGIITVPARPSCRKDPRHAVQRIDAQP